jgi:uncharacterized protein HemX
MLSTETNRLKPHTTVNLGCCCKHKTPKNPDDAQFNHKKVKPFNMCSHIGRAVAGGMFSAGMAFMTKSFALNIILPLGTVFCVVVSGRSYLQNKSCKEADQKSNKIEDQQQTQNLLANNNVPINIDTIEGVNNVDVTDNLLNETSNISTDILSLNSVEDDKVTTSNEANVRSNFHCIDLEAIADLHQILIFIVYIIAGLAYAKANGIF